jgi:hypothetical protein
MQPAIRRFTMKRQPNRTDPPDKAAEAKPLAGLGRTPGNGALPPPELALMRAVLQDAILCYLGRARRRRIDPRILSREAEHWLRVNDWESPFSFNNVCEALGLCHESTRRSILAWKKDAAFAAKAHAMLA